MRSLLDHADKLHSAPQVAASLLRLTADEDYDARAVVECLESDPALTAQLLRLVNSARYGLPNQVSNLSQAVMLVGRHTLRLTVLSFSIVESLTRGISKQLYEQYWRRALTLANAAKKLAERKEDVDENDAYTAALLADLGVLLLAQAKPEEYGWLAESRPHGTQLVEAEQSKLGFDHAQLGARLLEKWNFPDPLVRAIELHHEDEEHDALSRTVRGANIVAEGLWNHDAGSAPATWMWLERHCGVDLDAFIDLAMACKDDVSAELEIFGVPLGGVYDFDALVEEARRRYAEAAMEMAMDLDCVCAVMDAHVAPECDDASSSALPSARLQT